MLGRAAGRCARLAAPYAPSGELSPASLLDALDRVLARELDRSILKERAARTEDALRDVSDPAAASATLAAVAAARTLEDPTAAASAAALAADAAVHDAGECAMLAALRFTQEETARVVRETIDVAAVARAVREGRS